VSRRSKGSFIGGSTVITVHQSDKRMAERQAHWRRKLGHDRIVRVQSVTDDDGPRLIKRAEMQQPAPSTPRPTTSVEPPRSGYGLTHGKNVRKMRRKGTEREMQ
jgi:hypothetical protein